MCAHGLKIFLVYRKKEGNMPEADLHSICRILICSLMLPSVVLVLEWLCTQCRPHGFCCDCREDSQQLNDKLWVEISFRVFSLYESRCG